jgi:integrase
MTSITIGDFRQKVLKKYLARGRAKKTITQIKQVLDELEALGVRETGDISDDTIDDWLLAWPSRTTVTFKSHLRCLSALCTLMKKREWIAVDPFADESVAAIMRNDSRPSPPRRRYSKSREDVCKVLAQAKLEAAGGSWFAGRDQMLANLVFLLGSRVGQILRIETTDVDRTSKTITIGKAKWITNSRGGQVWWKPKTVGEKVIPIGDALLEMILFWSVRMCRPPRRRRRICTWLLPTVNLTGPWTSGGTGWSPLDRMKALGERAGVPDLTNKAGRKGLGTYKDLLTPMERREYFGHSDEATGDYYNDERIDSMRPAAIKIEQYFLSGT